MNRKVPPHSVVFDAQFIVGDANCDAAVMAS